MLYHFCGHLIETASKALLLSSCTKYTYSISTTVYFRHCVQLLFWEMEQFSNSHLQWQNDKKLIIYCYTYCNYLF